MFWKTSGDKYTEVGVQDETVVKVMDECWEITDVVFPDYRPVDWLRITVRRKEEAE